MPLDPSYRLPPARQPSPVRSNVFGAISGPSGRWERTSNSACARFWRPASTGSLPSAATAHPALGHARPRDPDHLATEGGEPGPMTANREPSAVLLAG